MWLHAFGKADRAQCRRSDLVTPTTTEGVHDLYRMLEEKLGASLSTSHPCLQKILHATEKAFADRF